MGTFLNIKRVPTRPFRPAVEQYLAREGVLRSIEAYSQRFGVQTRVAQRDLSNIRRQDYVTEEVADRVCVFIGRNPAELWPDWLWADVEMSCKGRLSA